MNLSIALSEKLAMAKNDNQSTPMLKQLVCEIQAEEGLATQDNRFLTGREIIRHIGTWAAVKSDHGQKYNISDLLRMRLRDDDPDSDLYEFYFRWKDVYTCLYGRKEPEVLMLDAIHDTFFGQIRRCTGRAAQAIIEKYEFDVLPNKNAYDCYQW